VQLTAMQDANGQPLEVALGSPLKVFVPLGGPVQGALLAKLLEPAAA